MSDDSDDTGDDRVYGMRHGECVDNADPLRLGRVKVRIPGLIEDESSWALPLGFGGHSYDVPATRKDYAARTPPEDRDGDEVAVWFADGDVDHPFYRYAHGGMPDGKTPEVPEPVKTMAPADAAWLKAWEWAFFRVELDERPATRGIRVTDKSSQEVLLEYDAVNLSLKLKGIAELHLESDGAVHILAAVCEIMKRRVMVSTDDL